MKMLGVILSRNAVKAKNLVPRRTEHEVLRLETVLSLSKGAG